MHRLKCIVAARKSLFLTKTIKILPGKKSDSIKFVGKRGITIENIQSQAKENIINRGFAVEKIYCLEQIQQLCCLKIIEGVLTEIYHRSLNTPFYYCTDSSLPKPYLFSHFYSRILKANS